MQRAVANRACGCAIRSGLFKNVHSMQKRDASIVRKIQDMFSFKVSPIVLINPSQHANSFRVLSDATTIQGKSEGSVQLLSEDEKPFLRMAGEINTDTLDAAEGVKRSGFCQFRYTFRKSLDMSDFKAFEFDVRTDGRWAHSSPHSFG